MRFFPSTLITIQGMIWFFIGVFLLSKGVFLISLVKSINGMVFFICFALLCGWLKGRYILIRVIQKNVFRLIQMSAPIPLKKIYEGSNFVIIALMIALGIILRSLGLNNDIYGFILVVIGSALINGAFLTFRFALEVHRMN